MPGVAIVIQIERIVAAQALLSRIGDLDATELLTNVGELGESQTRRRITDEKTSPDGVPWRPNLTGTSILMESGQHLLGSVGYIAGADQVQWGESWEFAHVHQDGAVISAKNAEALRFKVGDRWARKKSVTIPARPSVGLSAENGQEIEQLVTDHLAGLLQ